MYSPSWPWAKCLALGILCAAIAGCGANSKGRARVKGKVKFFDKNLTCGTVAFFGKDGQVGTANIDFDGNYEMNDAPLGEVKISVKVPKMGAGPMAGKGPAKPPGNMPPMRPPGGGGDDKNFVVTIDPKKIVEIPGKYADPDTSGLRYTVEKGEQTHNITLSP